MARTPSNRRHPPPTSGTDTSNGAVGRCGRSVGRTGPELLWAVLLEAVRVEVPRLHAPAVELLGRAGPAAVGVLLPPAADPAAPAGYRVRLLRIVRRIGAVPDPADRARVAALLTDPDPAVRAESRALLRRLRRPAR